MPLATHHDFTVWRVLEMTIVGHVDFDEYVEIIFSTDRVGVPEGMIEVSQ